MAEPTSSPNPSQATNHQQIVVEEPVLVRELADKLDVKPTALIAELIKLGVMASINDRVDLATAQGAAAKFDATVIAVEDEANRAGADSKKQAPKAKLARQGEARPPVVAVMGHVDHGKTSLLDKIRHTTVAVGEAGGITQHLRAHQVSHQGKNITFLDTPGHKAFSMLREHGAHLTDIALLVVAADDGVKPQTEEAIKFALKAGVKILVAITKVDKPGVDTNRVKQQLAEHGLNPEEWGGDTIMVEVSAVTGTGLDKLMEMIQLIAEVEELAAPKSGPAEGTIIETHIAKGQGVLATALVEAGELQSGDFVATAGTYAKIKRLQDVEGKTIKSATPSTPVVIAGWKDTPSLGARFRVVADEAAAKNYVPADADAANTVTTKSSLTAKPLGAAVSDTNSRQLLLIIKTDVRGSLEAVVDSLSKLGSKEVKLKIVSQGLGDVSESDVNLGESVGAQIMAFNVDLPVQIKQLAQRRGVPVRIYRVIYELIDDIQEQLTSLIEPKTVEAKVGELEIQGIFKITKTNLICGGLVKDGKISQQLTAKLVREGETTDIGVVLNVQREQQDVKEVVAGQMCGLNIKTDHKVIAEIGDILAFYKTSQQIS